MMIHLVTVTAILAVAFLFGFCDGSRRDRAQVREAGTLEPEVEIEPGASYDVEVQTDENVREDSGVRQLQQKVASLERTIWMMRASENLWKDEIKRFRQIRSVAIRILDRVRRETVTHAMSVR